MTVLWYRRDAATPGQGRSVLEDPFSYPDELSILRGELDDETGSLEIRNNRRNYRSEGIDLLLDWQIAGAGIDHQSQFGLRFHRDSEDRYQEEDSWSMVGGHMRVEQLGQPASQANRIDEAEAIAVFVRDSIYLGRWTISPGVRMESIHFLRSDFGKDDPGRSGENLVTRANTTNEILPGIGVNYSANPIWNLFGGAHRGFAPSGPGQDPDTRSETSWNYEFGARFSKGVSHAKTVAFYSDYSSLLGRDTLSSGGEGTGDAFNGGAVEVIGLEAAFDHDLGAARGWSMSVPLGLVYTYTRNQFLTSFTTRFPDWAPEVTAGDALPYLPSHQLGVSGGAISRRWSAFLNLAYVDAMRTTPGQGSILKTESTDANLVVDLSVGFWFTKSFALRLQARNLFDEVSVVARRPAGARPGLPRTILLGIDWSL